eukprot:scaffold3932_cov87-Cyclotella_meneghiniana.AAC.28
MRQSTNELILTVTASALILQFTVWIAFVQQQQYRTFNHHTKYFIYARLLIVDPLPVYCYVFMLLLLLPMVGRCTGSEWHRIMAISAI